MNKVIELKNISFSYKKNQVFNDFSVDFSNRALYNINIATYSF